MYVVHILSHHFNSHPYSTATLHSTNTFCVKFIIHSYVGKFITYTKNCQVSMSGIMFNVGRYMYKHHMYVPHISSFVNVLML